MSSPVSGMKVDWSVELSSAERSQKLQIVEHRARAHTGILLLPPPMSLLVVCLDRIKLLLFGVRHHLIFSKRFAAVSTAIVFPACDRATTFVADKWHISLSSENIYS